MAGRVPLIRAGAIKGILTEAERAGVPVERHLSAADLGWYPWDDLARPIPLLAVLRLLRSLAHGEGISDLGWRAVTLEALEDLGAFGRFILSARTPREVLRRARYGIASVCSHQAITLVEEGGLGRLTYTLPRGFDGVGKHVVHQFNAAATLLVAVTMPRRPGAIRQIAIPAAGLPLDALRARLGDRLVESEVDALVIEFDPKLVDLPFPRLHAEDVPGPPVADGDLAAVVAQLIDVMLDDGTPEIGRVAPMLGLSARTLQRELLKAGTGYRALLDQVRRERALAAIVGSAAPLVGVAATAGFADHACLTRAVRRWTGEAPSRLRAG